MPQLTNVGQLPPQAPLIPQLPQPAGPPSAVPVPQSPPQPVIPEASGGIDQEENDLDLRQMIDAWRQKVAAFVTQIAAPNAPPWLVSMLVHLVVILVLALIALPQIVESTFVVEVTYAEELGEQLFDDSQVIESLGPIETDPVLAYDAREVENPLASSALPQFKLELFDAAAEMETPAIGLALSGREPGAKRAMLAAYGGTGETENSVEMALEWLKRYQKSDGTWSLAGPYADGVAGTENSLAATAMALLAFQGAGNTHQSGDYKVNVKKGLDALLKMQDREGSFFSTQRLHSSHQLYSQAQATIVVCELYGMTEDSSLREHAQRALDYAGSIQADDGRGGGGWKYEPGTRADTSVTGWFVIALKSGEFGGLSVPSLVKDRVSRFLDNVAAMPGEGEQFIQGSRYLYQREGEKEPRVSMTAEALLCRQYLGWQHDDPRLLAGVQQVGEHPINWDEPHVYYWYYATQLMHHMGGDHWDEWNNVMRQALPAAQVKTGRERGSWSPAGDKFGYTGGRLFMTCLCTYMLEVYYRHMPIYQH
ncbi:MAG TPA: prenyltransferase/squalene oxidase repeat-containing protein [Pirellulaceae bacterium]|nr:prenyltransferase/squalene oxidase repeat-containing protein [Pirellulaceae bacterium]